VINGYLTSAFYEVEILSTYELINNDATVYDIMCETADCSAKGN
jgi:hypothetical protein